MMSYLLLMIFSIPLVFLFNLFMFQYYLIFCMLIFILMFTSDFCCNLSYLMEFDLISLGLILLSLLIANLMIFCSYTIFKSKSFAFFYF